MAQMVKNLPEMQETQVRSLGLEDTQGKGHSNTGTPQETRKKSNK